MKTLKLALNVLCVFSISSLGFAQQSVQHSAQHPAQHPGQQMMRYNSTMPSPNESMMRDSGLFHMLTELGLTDPQKEKVNAIRNFAETKQREKMQSNISLFEGMEKVLASDPLVEKKVAKVEFDKVTKAMNELAEMKFDMHYEVLSILTPSQRKMLNEMVRIKKQRAIDAGHHMGPDPTNSTTKPVGGPAEPLGLPMSKPTNTPTAPKK